MNARDLNPKGDRIGKLKSICRSLGATTYLSGPAAKSYIGTEFEGESFGIKWMEYGPYGEYSQFADEFEHGVSVLDLIAHCGPESLNFINNVHEAET